MRHSQDFCRLVFCEDECLFVADTIGTHNGDFVIGFPFQMYCEMRCISELPRCRHVRMEANHWPVLPTPWIRSLLSFPAEQTQISEFPNERRWSRCW